MIEGVLKRGELERDEDGGVTSLENGIRRYSVELGSCCRVSRTVCVCVGAAVRDGEEEEVD